MVSLWGQGNIEITSNNSALWRGEFYIQCHPNYVNGPRATFEFIQFKNWAETHTILPLVASWNGYRSE